MTIGGFCFNESEFCSAKKTIINLVLMKADFVLLKIFYLKQHTGWAKIK
jgi:hypothetical protein